MGTKRSTINRRDFIKSSAGLIVLPAIAGLEPAKEEPAAKTKVVVVRTSDRPAGIRAALAALAIPPPKGKRVFVKPNFNTADPPPGSTHNDTLAEIVRELKRRGAAAVTVGERSGPPPTQKVMEEKGIPAMAKELEFGLVNFEELAAEDWIKQNPPSSHWPEGFAIPRPVADSEYIVSTCCLKTHQFGGVFTMSLKLAVGLTPKSLMRQMHRSPDMRRMIAEINLAYRPAFILMDGVLAFVDGGPMTGKMVEANVILAGTDRVAIDAAGLAVLKELGANEAIMNKRIFEQEQIQRAVELGIGASGPDRIEIVPADAASRAYAGKLRDILGAG